MEEISDYKLKKDYLKKQIETYKIRLKNAPKDELEIWGHSIDTLLELAGFIEENIEEITEDEITSFWNLFKMANLIHDTTRDKDQRKKEVKTFDSLLKQNISYYKLFKDQILNRTIISQGDYDKDLPLIQKSINDLYLNYNYLGMAYIFAHRDIPKNPYIIDTLGPFKSNILKKYEEYYESLLDLKEQILEEIRNFMAIIEANLNNNISYNEIEEIKIELNNYHYLLNLYLECLKSKDLKTLNQDKVNVINNLNQRRLKNTEFKKRDNPIFK